MISSSRQLSRSRKDRAREFRRNWFRNYRPFVEPLEERVMLASDVISVGRTLSEWSVVDITDDELTIDYTVYNQQGNKVSGVLLTTTLEPGVTFVTASQLPDQNGQELAWSLGTLDPFGRASVQVTVSFDGTIPLQLDDGAEAFGTVDAAAVNDAANPAMLRADAIDPALLAATPDANWEDPFIQAKAAELNQDADAIFEFVRDEIGYESYVGSLRGARGTLWSEAGNALDQSSLMIGLLRASGVPSQYVSGTLADADAQELILSMFPEPFQVVGFVPLGTEVADPANDPGLLAETRQHFWVELDIGIGSGFQPFDPAFRDATIGQTFATADDKFAEVSDALRHKTTVQLDVEITNTATSLFGIPGQQVNTVLEETFNTVDLVGRPLSIGHFLDRQGMGTSILSAVTNSYTPYFILGDNAFPDTDTDAILVGEPYQEVLTTFPLSSTVVTGLFLNVTLSGPNVPSETFERALIDRIGIAKREGLGLPAVSIDPDSPPFLTDFDVFTLNVHPGMANPSFPGPIVSELSELAVLAASQLSTGNITPATKTGDRMIVAMTRALSLGLMTASDATTNRLANDLLVKSYFDRPRLIIVSSQVFIESTGDPLDYQVGIDLLRDTLRVISFPGQAKSNTRSFQAIRGVAEAVVETIVPQLLSTTEKISEEAFLVSTTTVFAESAAQGIELKLITPGEIATLDAINLLPEVRARVTRTLSQGNLVIIPAQSVFLGSLHASGWFQVNPNTGEVMGLISDGTHGSRNELQSLIRIDPPRPPSFFIDPILDKPPPSSLAKFNEKVKGKFRAAGDIIGDWITTQSGAITNIATQGKNILTIRDVVAFIMGSALFTQLIAFIRNFFHFSLPPFLQINQQFLSEPNTLSVAGIPGLGRQFLPLVEQAIGVRTSRASSTIPPSNPVPLVPFGRNEPSNDRAIQASISAGVVNSNLETDAIAISGNAMASWDAQDTNSFFINALTAENAIVTDEGGNPLGTGTASLSISDFIPVSTIGDLTYDITGEGRLTSYPQGADSNGVSGDWIDYDATLTGDATLVFATDALQLNGITLPAGTYSISTNLASLTGSGLTSSPTFSNAIEIQATDANVQVGAGTGTFNIGGAPIAPRNGVTLDGYTGTLNLAANGNSQTVILDGNAEKVLAVSGNPATFITDQNNPVSFQFNVITSESETYHLDVLAPEGWIADIDDAGMVTVTPPPGIQGGTHTIHFDAKLLSQPDFVAHGSVDVTITATLPGINVELAQDPDFTVPFNGAQVPTAFRATIQNLGPAADTFDLAFSNVPTGFDLISSLTTVTIPAGETGIVGIYLLPNGQIPAPGTPIAFDLDVTSMTDGSISQSETVSITTPEIHAIKLSPDPLKSATIPGAGSQVNLTVSSIGNVGEDVTFDAHLPDGLTLDNLSDISLNLGESQELTLTLTPDANVPLNTTLHAEITANFGSADPVVIQIPIRIAAPGADAAANAAILVDTLGNSDLSNRLDDLSIALTNLVQDPTNPIPKSQALASLDSILTLLAVDPLFVDFVDPLTDARNQLDAATTPTDIQIAIQNLGNVLDDFAIVVTNLAKHNFNVTLFPNTHSAQPLMPVDYLVNVQNVGSETTTYNLDVSGLPGSVTSQFAVTSLTVDPGQIGQTTLTLIQTSDTELLTFDFNVDVTVDNVTPEISKSAIGTMEARREFVSVTDVSADPAFGDPGTSFDISATILNAVNRQQDVLVSFTVDDPDGQDVFASGDVPATLTVQTSALDVDLGSLDSTGFAEGQYTVIVTVTDTDGNPIFGASGQTTLLIGTPITASLTVNPQLLPPGTNTITNTLDIAAVVPPSEQLELVGQLVERTPIDMTAVNAYDVHLNGDLAYVATASQGLVVDISDPANPITLRLFGFDKEFERQGDFLVGRTTPSGGSGFSLYSIAADPANPSFIGSIEVGNLLGSDFILADEQVFLSTNLVILQSGDITEQFGDVISHDTNRRGSVLPDDVLFNTFGTTTDGDEDPGVPRNGGPFNMFQMVMPDANTLYVASTTSTGTDVNTDENGDPAIGIVRLVDVTDPADISEADQLEIPGTTMVQGIIIDGDRAYVLGTQGGWRDPFTNAADIGPVGDIVMAVVDISDIANPTVIGTPTVINRSARGLGGFVPIGGNQVVFGSLGAVDDDPQIFLIDASDPKNLTVSKQIEAPGLVRRMSADDEFLYVATDTGLYIYSLGAPDVPVTAQVQIPNNTGVEVVAGSFNVDPTNVIPGVDFDTLVWDFTLIEGAATQTLTWDTTVTDLQPGESRPVTLDTTIDFTAQGTPGTVTLPPENVFAEQILSLDPAAQTAQPAEAATYTLTIDNPTAVDVSYDLTVQGVPQDWVDIVDSVDVAAGTSQDVTLTLTSDPFAPLGDFGFAVTATVIGTSGSVQGTLTLEGEPVLPATQPDAHGVHVAITPTQETSGQGTSAVYSVRLTNTGSITDTFDLSITLIDNFTTVFGQTSVEVPPGASNFRDVTLVITPPVGTTPDVYDFTVTATSTNHATILDMVDAQVSVVASGVDVAFDPTFGIPGDSFDLTITNTGQVQDTFDLALAAPVALVATLETDSVTLAPDESITVSVQVGEIDFAFPGNLPLVAIATSQTNDAVRDFDQIAITIDEFTGLDARFDKDEMALLNPGDADLLLLVDNIGNIEDQYQAVIIGTTGPLSASLIGLDGNPTNTIPLFRLPGLSSGALALQSNLSEFGEGTVTVEISSLENPENTRTVTATVKATAPPQQNLPPLMAVGADAGGGPHVKAWDPITGAEVLNIYAYDKTFRGGVRVAAHDVNGDGVRDIITGAGPGGGPHVKVFDGQTRAEIHSFMAYDISFRGGVYVGAGDLNNDGFADIITGAGPGGGPHVKVFDGKTGAEIRSFYAYDVLFDGGVRVAGGDVDGDGVDDIVTGAGPRGGPHVRVFSGRDMTIIRDFYAYDRDFKAGVYVASGDVNNDKSADIIVSSLVATPVLVFDGASRLVIDEFVPFETTPELLPLPLVAPEAETVPVRVAAIDQNADGRREIQTARGFQSSPGVRTLDGANHSLLDSFFAFNEFFGGVYVGDN